MAESLLRAARILSVPIVLTRPLAATMLSEVADVSPTTAEDLIHRLAATAGLSLNGQLNLAPSLRWELAADLQRESEHDYAKAAETAAVYYESKDDIGVVQQLGRDGSEIASLLLLMATDDRDEAARSVGERVAESILQGNFTQVALTNQLSRSVVHPVDQRLELFLASMSYWTAGENSQAAVLFRRLAAENRMDHIGAVSTHLLAVESASRGDLDTALAQARESLAMLREQGDKDGVAQVMTTLGVIEREVEDAAYSFGAAPSVDSVATLEDALRLAEEMKDYRQYAIIAGRLATSLFRRDRFDESVDVVLDALSRIPQESLPRQRFDLASVGASAAQRQGDFATARQFYDVATELAGEIGSLEEQARLLNQRSSFERLQGRAEAAVEYAKRSVAIGEELANDRHLSHAYHNLGRALGAVGQGEAALRYLDRATELLLKLQDARGLKMVQTTRSLIQRDE